MRESSERHAAVVSAREVPRQHVLVAAGYEHHAVARDPDAVDVDDAEGLVHHLRHRPYRPEEGGPPPEGSAAPRHIGLRPAREQPADEGREFPGRHVVGMRGAGAARPAAPSLGARRGPPVPLHGPSAGRAFHIIHGILPESVTFYREFPHATWENVNNRTHFLSEWEGGADNSLDQPKRLVPCLSCTAWGSSSRATASCGARCRSGCTRQAAP